MHCDKIGIKCHVKDKILAPLYEFRRNNPNNLGEIGNIKFMEVSNFFAQASLVKYKNVYTCSRCVSFGDIHADFLVLLTLLRLANLIDDTGNWTGSNTIVVFTGDLLDRAGREDPKKGSNTSNNHREEVDIVQYLYFLNLQARQVDGGVVAVVGNHDIARVFWKEMKNSYSKYIGDQNIGWGTHMNKMFEPGGLMAVFMAYNYPFIVKVNNFIFMHGGPTPEIINKISKKVQPNYVISFLNKTLFRMFNLPNSKISEIIMMLVHERQFSKPVKKSIEEKDCIKNIQTLLHNFGVKDPLNGGFVIGHSIQEKIETYCDGFVWRIDLGMSEAFGRKIDGLHSLGGILIKSDPTVSVTSFQTYSGSDEIIFTCYDKEKNKCYSIPSDKLELFP